MAAETKGRIKRKEENAQKQRKPLVRETETESGEHLVAGMKDSVLEKGRMRGVPIRVSEAFAYDR